MTVTRSSGLVGVDTELIVYFHTFVLLLFHETSIDPSARSESIASHVDNAIDLTGGLLCAFQRVLPDPIGSARIPLSFKDITHRTRGWLQVSHTKGK